MKCQDDSEQGGFTKKTQFIATAFWSVSLNSRKELKVTCVSQLTDQGRITIVRVWHFAFESHFKGKAFLQLTGLKSPGRAAFIKQGNLKKDHLINMASNPKYWS